MHFVKEYRILSWEWLWLPFLQACCLSTMPKPNSWCTLLKPSSSSRLFQLSWWESIFFQESTNVSTCFAFELPDHVLPPAGVERQLLSSDGTAGSQHGAKWAEEKQWHQQLQRKPHLDSVHLGRPRTQSLLQNATFGPAAQAISWKSYITGRRWFILFHMQSPRCMMITIGSGTSESSAP